MDFIVLTGWMVIVIVALSVIWIVSQQRERSPREKSKLVTQNLDYSILGQRPEIVTEDESEPEG